MGTGVVWMKAKRVLVAMPHLLEIDRDSGSRRVLNLIEFLQETGWSVSFVGQYNYSGERYANLLRQRGIATYIGLGARLEKLIAAENFDLAILVFWHVAELVMPIIRALSPTTPIIVDTIDLHFLREARELLRPSSENRAFANLDNTYANRLIRELNTYAAADAVLTVSQKEADLINDLTANPTLAYVTSISEELVASTLPMTERRGILFVGNFKFRPNIAAVNHFCHEILPHLDPQLMAEHPIYIVGDALDDTVRRLGKGWPHVKMIGWVPSLIPYYRQARISVVPLLHGAGTKGKLIRALLAGTPTVSTSIGVEGLDLQDGEHVLIADDPADFAAAIGRLLQDTALWQRLATQGQHYLSQRHGREVVRAQFNQVVSTVITKTKRKYEADDPASVSKISQKANTKQPVTKF